MKAKGYKTLHISVTDEDRRLFDLMMNKTRSRSQSETLRHALRALEEKEAARDRDLGQRI